MSDFLTRMAKLSRGEATIVTPRLPSLFSSIEEVLGSDDIMTPVHDQPGAAPDFTLADEVAESKIAVSSPLPMIRSELNAKDLISPGETASQPDLVKDKETVSSLIAPRNRNTKIHVTTGPETFFEENQKRSHSLPPPGTEHRHTSQPLRNVTFLEQAAAKDGDGPKSRERRERTQTQIDRFRSPPPLVQGHKDMNLQVKSLLPETTRKVARQEGSVHITIGRVEVRAQAAEPAPVLRTSPPKAPTGQSLKDYLKRGGGRP